MAEYISRDDLLKVIYANVAKKHNERCSQLLEAILNAPPADVAPVEMITEKIIRKKAEIHDFWIKDVKQYRAMQGYSDIERDVDNFLRGYNEAVDDIIAILDGTPKERGGEK